MPTPDTLPLEASTPHTFDTLAVIHIQTASCNCKSRVIHTTPKSTAALTLEIREPDSSIWVDTWSLFTCLAVARTCVSPTYAPNKTRLKTAGTELVNLVTCHAFVAGPWFVPEWPHLLCDLFLQELLCNRAHTSYTTFQW